MKHTEQTLGHGIFETIAPKILYFGTPVAIVSSANADGTTNNPGRWQPLINFRHDYGLERD